MTCHNCRAECRRFGKRKGRQRYQCCHCRKLFIDPRDKTLDGMYLPVEKAEAVLRLLLEGNTVSSVERFTEVHHSTILKLPVLAGEKAGNFQITTDGFAPYRTTIPNTLEDRADFAMLIKVYRATPEGERTCSPAELVATEVVRVMGRPDPARICTSHIERQNLSMRMGIRRCTRLTNAFSKKFENHAAAIMLWFAFYNFCRIHKTLRITPAMAAGISDHVWTVCDLLEAA